MPDKRRRRRRRSPSRALVGLVLTVVTVTVIGSMWGQSILTGLGVLSNGGSPTIPASLYSPTPASQGPGGHGVVGRATPAPQAAEPDPAAVTRAMAAVGRPPGKLGGIVVDVDSGTTMWSSGPQTLLMPASNLKVLTGVGLLAATDAGTRYRTRVVQDGPGKLVLVGGGDPYLLSEPSKEHPTFASTRVLARRSAAALKKAGTTTVTLGYDASLFTGPAWNPHWPASYADQVTPISALWVDEGLPAGQTVRSKQPAAQAAQVFATQLKAAGITVTGKPTAVKADADATPVAAVDSASVEDLLTEALLHSDNSTTEVLSRQMALASGQPASFEGAVTALTSHLRALGIWQDGAVVQDGSGLSRGNRVSAAMLARAWRAVDRTPRLEPMSHAVPVSGVSGSLSHRFDAQGTAVGRGVVHAKTGTLTGVASLSGWVRTADGRILAEAFILNDAADVWAARIWLDKASSALASCGCR